MDVRDQYSYLKPQPLVWISILGSAAAHAGLIVLLIIGGLVKESGGRENVKITALLKKGKPRDKKLLPRKPPAAAPAPPANARPPQAAKKADPKAARKTSSRVDSGQAMASAINDLVKEGGKDEEAEGSPDGVDEGTALIAEKGNEYMTKVYSAVKGQYSVPEIITERERMFLNAIVVITINARGQIKNLSFEKRSGNQVFDSAIEAAIRRSAPFPPPPPELVDKYSSEGIGIDFDARRL